jgi:hypothetical protein
MAVTTVTIGESPAVVNFTTKRGDTIGPFLFAFGMDLSDRTFAAQVRADLDETGDPVATWTIDSTDDANGNYVVELPDTECANLATVKGKATYYWDLQWQMNDASGTKTWVSGKISVAGDVTVVAP